MNSDVPRWVSFLHRRTEDAAALMMLAMFLTFIYQIAMRYVFNAPASWAEEICVTMWMWGVLWGTAFVTRRSEDIRIDIVLNLLSERGRRIADALSGLALVLIFGLGLPGAWSYVSFMKIETSAALRWPMHLVFSVYLLFAVAIIVRQAWVVRDAFRPAAATPA
jgi:TRAP-type C4-dicarboxylate transport system permease small subunit